MRTAIVVGFLALLAAACGGTNTDSVDQGGGEPGTPERPRIVGIDASEFAFTPDTVVFAPGETVEFIITNRGNILHDFQLTDEAGVAAHLAGDTPDGGSLRVEIRPGETMRLAVTFDDAASDLTEFVCFIPGHFEAGMAGELARR